MMEELPFGMSKIRSRPLYAMHYAVVVSIHWVEHCKAAVRDGASKTSRRGRPSRSRISGSCLLKSKPGIDEYGSLESGRYRGHCVHDCHPCRIIGVHRSRMVRYAAERAAMEREITAGGADLEGTGKLW